MFENLELKKVDFVLKEDKKEEEKSSSNDSRVEGNTQKFDTDEHIAIGDHGFDLFWDELKRLRQSEILYKLLDIDELETREVINLESGEKQRKRVKKIPLTAKLKLTPGEIVALAGDYYGVPEKPISFGNSEDEQIVRFNKAYETLIDDKKHNEVEKILRYAKSLVNEKKIEKMLKFEKFEDVEKDAKENANADTMDKKKEKSIISKIGDFCYFLWTNGRFNVITNEKGLLGAFWHSSYFKLGITNFDHFYEEAKDAFWAGYKLAFATAQKAAAIENSKEKGEKIRLAIGQILFASHFLTDLYAAGHMRTPRKQILNSFLGEDMDAKPDVSQVSAWTLTIAGLLAMKMHDEDGEDGLFVERCIKGEESKEEKESKEAWIALGDHAFYKKDNKYNARKACEIVKIALLDIFYAFQNSVDLVQFKDKVVFRSYLPYVTEQSTLPLLRIKDDRVQIRRKKVDKTLNTMSENYYKPVKREQLFRFYNVKLSFWNKKENKEEKLTLTKENAKEFFNEIDKAPSILQAPSL